MATTVKLYRVLNRELSNYPFLQDVEEATGIRKLNLVLLAGPIFILLRFLGYGPNAVCNLVGYAYPAVASMKAIETKGSLDDTQWLTYWTVFAALNLIEGILLKSLLQAFPFYYAFKFGLLIWAQAPSSRGAVFIYSHVLAPFFKTHSVVPAIQQQQT
jgi:receptor expression-enhancing protein 5/6